MSQSEILALFDDWNNACRTGDPKKVTRLYAENAVLLPTISNRVRHNHDEIEDYFVMFLANDPYGEIDEANVRVFGDFAINSGVYTFTLKSDLQITSRFTFVYRKNGDSWEILEHHSSQMPENQIKLP